MISSIRILKALTGIVMLAALGGFPMVGAMADVVYTYDALGRVTSARYDNGVCVAYTYDATGNRTAQSNVNGGAPSTPVWGSGVWGCFPWTP